METESEIVCRLRSWILAGANAPGLLAADLDPHFAFDNGAFCIEAPDAVEWVCGDLGEFVDVTLIAEAVGEGSLCMVVRGRDPVTEMWHQCAWLFEIWDNRVRRLVKTTSGGIPPRPYDGTLPLREVGG
jgi:hypothetical protein